MWRVARKFRNGRKSWKCFTVKNHFHITFCWIWFGLFPWQLRQHCYFTIFLQMLHFVLLIRLSLSVHFEMRISTFTVKCMRIHPQGMYFIFLGMAKNRRSAQAIVQFKRNGNSNNNAKHIKEGGTWFRLLDHFTSFIRYCISVIWTRNAVALSKRKYHHFDGVWINTWWRWRRWRWNKTRNIPLKPLIGRRLTKQDKTSCNRMHSTQTHTHMIIINS